jgi:acyl-CoA reductase-like NAD-dependent aldehyde dehydrogenase
MARSRSAVGETSRLSASSSLADVMAAIQAVATKAYKNEVLPAAEVNDHLLDLSRPLEERKLAVAVAHVRRCQGSASGRGSVAGSELADWMLDLQTLLR